MLYHDVMSFAIHMFTGLFFQNALVDHIVVCTDTNYFIVFSLNSNNHYLMAKSRRKQMLFVQIFEKSKLVKKPVQELQTSILQ